MVILAATKLNCLCWSVEMKHVQKKRLRNDFYFFPCVEEEMDESAFSLFCSSWLDLISAETNSRKCFERQRKLAEFSYSMYIYGTLCTYLGLTLYSDMFLMNACDADSFSLIGCDNLGESAGGFACTLWLDFRNLQASPQFLRDEPPTRKTAYKPRVAVIIHQDLACTRFSNQLLVLVLQLVLIMYASQELYRPFT